MGRDRLRHVTLWIALLSVLAVLGSGLVAEAHREATDPGNSDAIAFAAGAHLVLADPRQLYDPAAQQRVEAELLKIPQATGFIDPFTNLAAGAVLLSPLARGSLRTGSGSEVVAAVLLMCGALLVAIRLFSPETSPLLRVLIAGSAVFSVPAVSALIQWDALMLVALLGSVLLAERQAPWMGRRPPGHPHPQATGRLAGLSRLGCGSVMALRRRSSPRRGRMVRYERHRRGPAIDCCVGATHRPELPGTGR